MLTPTKTKNRLLGALVVTSALYFFLYWSLNDLFLYAIGGALGTVVRLVDKQTNVPLLTCLWLALLGVATWCYYQSSSRPVKYLFLLLVAVLLYVVDFILYILYDIMSFEVV